ncbi:MAG TPA: TonB-dependent receptor, partial [Bacteroidetes bacterium]|nr:TonB-dependent receptor [Bacteroidota bacterium]
MKYIITLLFIVVSNVVIYSQFTIEGNVQNEEGNPIEFAQVYLDNTSYDTETNEEGFFKLNDIKTGSYVLKVYLLGFEPYEKQIFIDKNISMKIVLKERTYNLKEIEINALKVSEKMPFAYKNINKKQIEERNYGEDIPYLLKNTPSVVTTSDAGAGIGYTGLRIRGTDPTRINVTVNGIPLNDAESQLVYWVDLPDISGSTDNIQIQRGVGTSTNGAGAFGATINLNTETVNPKPYLSLEGTYGSYNTSKISAKAGTGIMNEKYSVDIRYTSIKSDGYIDRASSALNSFFFSGTRLYENSSLKFNAIIGKEKTYQAWYGVPIQYIDTARTFNLAGTDYFSKQPAYDNQVDDYSQNHLQLFYNKKFNESTLLNLAAHYTKGSGYYEQYKVDEDLYEYNLDTSSVKSSDIIRQKWLDNDFYGIVYSFKKQFETSELI